MFGLPQFQLELREFIRRLNGVGELLYEARRRVEGLEQATRDARRAGLGNTCLSSFLGRVIGCHISTSPGAAPLLLDSNIRIVGHETARDYGTFPLASGLVDLSLYVDLADSNLDAYVTGPGSRFAEGLAFGGAGFIRCSISSFGDLTAPAAPGYTCYFDEQFPILGTLTLDDSHFGTSGSVTFNPATFKWEGTIGGNDYRLVQGAIEAHTIIGGVDATWPGSWVTARSHPDALASKFSITFTAPVAFGPYAMGDTIRFYEP